MVPQISAAVTNSVAHWEFYNFIISIPAVGTDQMQIQEAGILAGLSLFTYLPKKKEGANGDNKHGAVLLCLGSAQISPARVQTSLSLSDHQWGLGAVHGAGLTVGLLRGAQTGAG